jgi:glycosyltransferase involved in cell wall biosynthesis
VEVILDLVSVVIPVKNGGATLGRTLESLRRQTCQHFEVVVVDGGSTDNTLDVIEAAALPNLQLLSDPNGGITTAVNKGLRASSGTILIPWLCSDDFLDPKFVGSMAESLKGDAEFAYGNWHGVDGGIVIKSRRPDLNWERKIRYSMPVLMSNSFAFRRTVFEKIGYMNEGLRYACDYDFLRRIQDAGIRGAYSPDAWYYYQTGGLSQTRQFTCAREVARSAISHGSPMLLTYAHLGKAYLAVRSSFALNWMRKQWRTRVGGRQGDASDAN